MLRHKKILKSISAVLAGILLAGTLAGAAMFIHLLKQN